MMIQSLYREAAVDGCPISRAVYAREVGILMLSYAAEPQLRIGKLRILFFVAEYMALQSAGAIGGTDGSPIPVGASWLGTAYTSTVGVSSMRSGA